MCLGIVFVAVVFFVVFFLCYIIDDEREINKIGLLMVFINNEGI